MTPPRFIKVGRIGCVLEPDAVRYIGVAGAELLRRVHVTVRDRAWNTIVPRVEARQEHASDAAIQQNSELHYEHADLAIRVRLHIAVARRAEQTEIDIRLAMTALRDSQVNRAGLGLLLPVADLAGRTARLTRLDLGTTDLVFPSLISAHPLFSDATALEYTLNGSRVQIVFEGERFECEDHRNWGDDSYKVYCGNLRTPRPIRLRAAETIEQRICVTIQPGERRDIANRPAHIVQLGRRINCWPARVSPQRSTCERSADKCFDLTELTIDTTDPASLAPAVPPAGQAWQLVVRTADATSLARLDARFDTASVVIVHRIGAPVTDDALLRAARERFPNATIAGGTAGAFCEINRARARVGSWDAVCFS
ncbi:MAG TPA: hypothetical protein PKB10_07065, partial [Tepidisphaeraceae bacterium]|nr:hypothetical protein [Tepidisphaeraceae bacterium]